MRDYSPLRGLAAASPTVHLKSSTVVELLDELDKLRAAATAPAKVKRNDYPADFEVVWEVYPGRPGDSKKAAHKAWASRLKAGATATEMLAGAQAYAAYVKVMRIEPQFIKQGATFFGPGEHFSADWTPPPASAPKPAAAGAWWVTDATILAKGTELGLRPHAGESMPSFKGRIQAAIDNGGTPPAPSASIRPAGPAANAPEPRGVKPPGLDLKALLRGAPPPPAQAA
jgi:hypothetical protein